EETLKRGAEEAFGFLPSGPVSKGQKWNSEALVPMGPIGTFKTKTVYQYRGNTSSGEEIDLEASLSYTPPKSDAGADMPFKVLKGDLKAENAKGTIIFNATTGRLVSYSLNMTIKGVLTLEVMGNNVTMDLTQEMQSRITVSDTPPAAE